MDVAGRVDFPVADSGPCRQISPSSIVRATISPFQPTTMKTQTRRFHARSSLIQGFTLIEVIVAMSVFLMVTLGIYTMLFQSYEMVQSIRYRDAARAVLESFGDQFLRLQTTDLVNGVVVIRPLFQVRTGSDMTGLWWHDLAKPVGEQDIEGTTDGLTVTLSSLSGSTLTSASPITATVTEAVTDLNDTDGTPRTGSIYTAAGRMLQGQFTISYTLGRRVHTQTLTVARSVR
jgi:prepilin-type N-terminal cleavage/methylation domain-containing protein